MLWTAVVFVLLLHAVDRSGICTAAACCGLEWYLYCCCLLWTGVVLVLLLPAVDRSDIRTAACVDRSVLHGVEWYLYCCMLWTGVCCMVWSGICTAECQCCEMIYCCIPFSLLIYTTACCRVVFLPVDSTYFYCYD